MCLGGNTATYPNSGEESSEAMTTAMESEVGSSLTQEVLGIHPHTRELGGTGDAGQRRKVCNGSFRGVWRSEWPPLGWREAG